MYTPPYKSQFSCNGGSFLQQESEVKSDIDPYPTIRDHYIDPNSMKD